MRLTPIEQQVIRDASLRYFGVRPRLFGSRVNDAKRGGDIDLYIEAPVSPKQGVEARLHMVADIWKELGERKIDVVVNSGGEQLAIYEVAQREGILL
jgi:predicted nucleotidyltransferase